MKHVDGKDGSGDKYIYPFGGPYGYTPFGKITGDPKTQCYYIESIHGEMLIGYGLPNNEEEAIQYCRCANIAFARALCYAKRIFKNCNEKVETEIDKLGEG